VNPGTLDLDARPRTPVDPVVGPGPFGQALDGAAKDGCLGLPSQVDESEAGEVVRVGHELLALGPGLAHSIIVHVFGFNTGIIGGRLPSGPAMLIREVLRYRCGPSTQLGD